jgi:hypothetical protein
LLLSTMASLACKSSEKSSAISDRRISFVQGEFEGERFLVRMPQDDISHLVIEKNSGNLDVFLNEHPDPAPRMTWFTIDSSHRLDVSFTGEAREWNWTGDATLHKLGDSSPDLDPIDPNLPPGYPWLGTFNVIEIHEAEGFLKPFDDAIKIHLRLMEGTKLEIEVVETSGGAFPRALKKLVATTNQQTLGSGRTRFTRNSASGNSPVYGGYVETSEAGVILRLYTGGTDWDGNVHEDGSFFGILSKENRSTSDWFTGEMEIVRVHYAYGTYKPLASSRKFSISRIESAVKISPSPPPSSGSNTLPPDFLTIKSIESDRVRFGGPDSLVKGGAYSIVNAEQDEIWLILRHDDGDKGEISLQLKKL